MTYLTEAEAREEDCPHIVEWYVPNGSPANILVSRPIKCRAAACKMAWRWHKELRRDPDDRDNIDKITFVRERGFCGIAGRLE